jgi:hypothetical protein
VVQCSARQSANRWWPLGACTVCHVSFAASVLLFCVHNTFPSCIPAAAKYIPPDGMRRRCNSHCRMPTLPDAIIYPSGLSRSWWHEAAIVCALAPQTAGVLSLPRARHNRCLQLHTHALCTLSVTIVITHTRVADC